MIGQGTFIVEYIHVVEDVSTLEIPYYPVQIPVVNTLVTPLVITVPAPFSYKSTKVIPRNYGSTVYLYEQKLEEKPLEIQEPIVIITGTGGMTRNGRVFASAPPREKKNLGAATKNKGK